MRKNALQIMKKTLLALGILSASVYLLGGFFWLATSKKYNHYLLKSIQNEAAVSVWLAGNPDSSSRWFSLGLMHSSVWIQTSTLNRALGNFDNWIQEFALVKEATEEAIEDESYELPPSILPEPPGEVPLISDPYDVAFQNLMEDVLNSGFVGFSGSVHLKTPIWAKPFMGWLTADIFPSLNERIFDSRFLESGLREDGADLLSWMSELPFAHLGQEKMGDITVHESVFDVGGEQIASLHSRLCELENIPEYACELSDERQNPLEPLLFLTEHFKAQMRIYWSLRGEHLVWASTRSCLRRLLDLPTTDAASCSAPSGGPDHPVLNRSERKLLTSAPSSAVSGFTGVFFHQKRLEQVFSEVSNRLLSAPLNGGTWLFDVLQTAHGKKSLEVWSATISEAALLRPSWAARLSLMPQEKGQLVTLSQHATPPASDEKINHKQAENEFDFLYSLASAWHGLPRGRARLEQAIPWRRQGAYWEAMSVYGLGWRESE